MDEKTIINELPVTELKKSDFYYDLPQELIAQTPAEKRDMSRLMVIDRDKRSISDKVFKDVIDYLSPGDVLVINDTRVIPARLNGIKESTGINVETLLLRQRGLDEWECIVKPGRRLKVGTTISYGDGIMRGTVVSDGEDGVKNIKFEYQGDNIYTVLEKIGSTPLPPYITSRESDPERYQTVYARENGSAAAPTAGLHFTKELLEKIKEKGIKVVPVLLHVGLGTFRPVKEDNIKDHIMHTEYIHISKESADAINSRTGKLVAVGTTSCRALESAADEDGKIRPVSCDTGIFIYPGYKFKAVDALITNFHLPESTLIMLVSAFADRDFILEAYKAAVEKKYRFFSFGDAMIIL